MASAEAPRKFPMTTDRADSLNVCDVGLADIEGMKGFFSGEAIDHDSPCTATEDRTCQIARHLTVWNEVLSQAKLELRESARTRAGMTVASIDCPYVRDHSLDTLHRVATLLHCLVKKHHCVTHLDVTMGRLNLYDELLCDALRGNQFIETLKLRDSIKWGLSPHRNFCAVVPTLRNLKHFECTSEAECRQSFLDAVTSLLLTTKSLTSLHVPNLNMKRSEAKAFLTATTACSSLRELSLNFEVVASAPEEICATFAEYLKSSTALTTLNFVGKGYLYCTSMQLILRGLVENRTIAKLDFRTAFVAQQCVEAVTAIFAKNRTLRSVHIVPDCPSSYSYFYHMGYFIWNGWLTSLTQNETLQELTLPFYIWRPEQWALFFRALSTKQNLKHVIIGGGVTRTVALQEVCEALRESGAEEKVVFGPQLGVSCYRHDFHFLRYRCFRDVVASQGDGGTDAPPLGRLLHQLCSLNHVTSLTVSIDPGTYTEDLSSALTDYVGTTTTLKKLRLISESAASTLNETDLAWTSVVESLSRNSSLAELGVSATCMSKDDSERMADAVKHSENIRRFSVSVQKGWHMTAFVSRLSEGISGNYSLLRAEFPGYMNKDSFAVWDTARRNSSLVARASQFLAGAHPDNGWRWSESCGTVLCWRNLPKSSPSAKDEAAAALRDEVGSFEGMHDFMRLAGVVKERVTCHHREDGRKQLDDLNEHCWIAIRRYIVLGDVVDVDAPS
ncbi:hypothetical protein HPB49_023012 [Dermacentor silvarum]|uniref:Uncharacterized protein n=1 Tax=Dermacentor silvarum TaxID=543639 RepID=A0ACB8CTN1_DERSI|nr:uncharacterized protein LOC125945656 [Dermacentor silvarum]KAH7950357.1 hypothetical protein HPB49_023012 [Dermacentor silvarum]